MMKIPARFNRFIAYRELLKKTGRITAAASRRKTKRIFFRGFMLHPPSLPPKLTQIA
jgi:hypothetical protein